MNCPVCNKMISVGDKFCPFCGTQIGVTQNFSDKLPIGTILNGKYKIESVFEENSSQITYVAQDVTLQMKVIINEFYPKEYVTRESGSSPQLKVCDTNNAQQINQWQQSFLENARKRAKVVGLVGIADVRDYFEQNGTAYVVIDWLKGDSLEEFINKTGYSNPDDAKLGMGKRITAETAKKIMEPVILSLMKVHESSSIYGDICIENMRFGGDGGLKILRTAWEIEYKEANDKTIVLKMGYAPEECYRGMGNRGPWTDVYSICAILYKCITGITPINANERIRMDMLKRPSELGIDIKPYDEAAIMMGLAVYADRRFADMNALYKALYKANPIVVYPDGEGKGNQGKKGGKNQKRKKSKTKIAVIISLIAFVFIAIGIVGVVFISNSTLEFSMHIADNQNKYDKSHKSDEDDESDDEDENSGTDLSEDDIASYESILKQAEADESVENQKDALEQLISFVSDNNAAEYASEDIADIFDTYKTGVLDHIALLDSQNVLPAIYTQMNIELTEALDLASRIGEQDIEVDSDDLQSKSDTLKTDYKQRLIDNFDNEAQEEINTNGVISRSVLWAAMDGADQTGLYDEVDYSDPLRLRYILALTYHVDSELDSLGREEAAARLYEVIGSADYNPLLLYYLGDLNGDEYAEGFYRYASDILADNGYDFYNMTTNEKRNFMYYYYTDDSYVGIRDELLTYMRDNFTQTQ